MNYYGTVLDYDHDFISVSTEKNIVMLKVLIKREVTIEIGLNISQARETARHLIAAADAQTASEHGTHSPHGRADG